MLLEWERQIGGVGLAEGKEPSPHPRNRLGNLRHAVGVPHPAEGYNLALEILREPVDKGDFNLIFSDGEVARTVLAAEGADSGGGNVGGQPMRPVEVRVFELDAGEVNLQSHLVIEGNRFVIHFHGLVLVVVVVGLLPLRRIV